MGAAHPVDRRLYFGHGAERGGGDVRRSPRQPSQGVTPVAGVLFDAGHHLGMGGLNEQRPDPTDERRRVGDQPPRDRAGAHETWISPVLERVLEGVRGVLEQRQGCFRHAAPGTFGHRLHRPVETIRAIHRLAERFPQSLSGK